MKKIYIKITIMATIFAGLLAGTSSCTSDLEQIPVIDKTAGSLYRDYINYHTLLAKVYGCMAVGGQEAGDGQGDIADIDGGFSNYLRLYYYLQNITTDEAVIGWNDGSLPTLHLMTWNSSNEFINAMYYRLYTQIAFSNDFIRWTTDDKLSEYGFSGDQLTDAKYMRAESRFIRAQAHYHLLDLFGNAPFMIETDFPGTIVPQQTSRAQLYEFVEKELLACADELKDPRTNEYGRADKAAAWALLAKLYLNSEVYVSQNRYQDVISYCDKIISAGYSLKNNYASLFMADNNASNSEVIFPVCYDGTNTQTYGGTTFLICGATGGSMNPSDLGVGGGWAGMRVTQQFVDKFESSDKRGNFWTNGQDKEVTEVGDFKYGYAFIKYTNVKSTGVAGNNSTFADTDIPLYRLADIYLMYAEANLRGGGGDAGKAMDYVNALRNRGGASAVSSINVNFILDERARELSWEFTRRTDLIRYGLFTTGGYLWAWKGGAKDGQSVETFRNIYPIPENVLNGNPNLKQNEGYGK